MKVINLGGGETVIVGDEDWKDNVLSADPFMGDICDGTILTNKIVRARTSLKLCNGCLEVCQPKTFVRVMSEKVDGELHDFRFCEDCCTAMAFELYQDANGNIVDIEDDEAWEAATIRDPKTGEWIEPEDMLTVRERLRDINEKHLTDILGRDYMNAPDRDRYDVMNNKANTL